MGRPRLGWLLESTTRFWFPPDQSKSPSRMEQEENHSGKGSIPILNSGTPVERRHSFKLHRKHYRPSVARQ